MILLNKLTEEQLAVIKAHQDRAWTKLQNKYYPINKLSEQTQNRRLNAAHKGQAAFFQQFNQVTK